VPGPAAAAAARSLPPFTFRNIFPQFIGSTAAVTAAVTVGDVGCQFFEQRLTEHGAGWDRHRTARMATAACIATGPLGFFWNQFLERQLPGRELRQVFRKMLANGLFAPVQIAASFTVITLLSGRTMADARAKVKQDLAVTFLVGSTYWPFIGFIQFRFVPLLYRPAVGSVAGAVYQMFFSGMANRPVLSSTDVAEGHQSGVATAFVGALRDEAAPAPANLSTALPVRADATKSQPGLGDHRLANEASLPRPPRPS